MGITTKIAMGFAACILSMTAGADVMRCHAKNIVPPDSISVFLSGPHEFFHAGEAQGNVRAVIVEGGLKSSLEFKANSYYHKKLTLDIFNSQDQKWPQDFSFSLTQVGRWGEHSNGEQHPILMSLNNKSYEMQCSYRVTP
jgi:hypothetical protein